MFVSNVNCVKSAEMVIASDVWLYNVDNHIDDALGRDLYLSAVNGGYQFLPSIPDWKPDVLTVAAGLSGDDVGSEQIEGRAEIVQRVAHDERHALRQLARHLEVETATTRVRVLVDTNGVKVSLGESIQNTVQLCDVLVGPFNL
jgi:hypothetical protein